MNIFSATCKSWREQVAFDDMIIMILSALY